MAEILAVISQLLGHSHVTLGCDNKFSSDVKKYAMSAFDDIIGRVRRSNLNFQLQLSPFSAVISFKMSVVIN